MSAAQPPVRHYMFVDVRSNLHPYECSGRGFCAHCDRAITEDHHPATCALCDPVYDHYPNGHRLV